MNSKTNDLLESIRERLTEGTLTEYNEVYSPDDAKAVGRAAKAFANAAANSQPSAVRASLVALLQSLSSYAYEAADEGMQFGDSLALYKLLRTAATKVKTKK